MLQKVHFRLTSVAQKRCCLSSLLGTLRSDNGEANGDVAEKPYFFAFKRFLPCTKSLSYLKVGKLSWS